MVFTSCCRCWCKYGPVESLTGSISCTLSSFYPVTHRTQRLKVNAFHPNAYLANAPTVPSTYSRHQQSQPLDRNHSFKSTSFSRCGATTSYFVTKVFLTSGRCAFFGIPQHIGNLDFLSRNPMVERVWGPKIADVRLAVWMWGFTVLS